MRRPVNGDTAAFGKGQRGSIHLIYDLRLATDAPLRNADWIVNRKS
ncbi:MAG TPA: hypothetical protein VN784_03225 [Candidatus Limnocylindrales bacterium]|nr:hypothetical protein [Candidatus Limnocylindrales bacterium]